MSTSDALRKTHFKLHSYCWFNKANTGYHMVYVFARDKQHAKKLITKTYPEIVIHGVRGITCQNPRKVFLGAFEFTGELI